MLTIPTSLFFATIGVLYGTLSHASGASTDIFSASCYSSHVANDDPIIFPGQPGAAHPHEFSGAWSTDANSTADSLRASGTTCDPSEDTAAYWTPVLYMKGQRAEIEHTTAYYAPGRKANQSIKAWPQGFRMIADIKNNSYEKSGYPHAGWLCGSEQVKWGYESSLEEIKYHCPYGLQARIVFPECWDGVNLDTIKPDGTPAKNPVTGQIYPNDHRSHAVYVLPPPASGDCPPAYPVATPRLDLKINFKTQGLVDSKANRPSSFTSESKIQNNTPYDAREPDEGDNPSDFTLAGGGVNGASINNNYPVSTYHADFYNGWDPARLEYLIDYCIRQEKAQQNTRPCLNPDTTPGGERNPNYPNATQPNGSTAPPALDTTITSAPADPTASSAASSFSFNSNTAGATFACKLDAAEYTNCTSPASYTSLSPGSHTFSVKATAGGVTDSSPATRSWTVSPPTPTPPPNSQYISFLSPTAGETVSGRVDIQISAKPPTSGESISLVELLVDGQVVNDNSSNKSTPYKMTWDARDISNGSHTLQARVTDGAGVSAMTTISVVVDNGGSSSSQPQDTQSPTVSINSPANGAAVSGIITASASAVDPPSSTDGAGISKVEFFVDGASKLNDLSSPYNYSLDTRTLSNGSHVIKADAYDQAGNKATSSVNVTVSNADTIAPSIPSNLTATANGSNSVNLSWSASSDAGSGVEHYNLLRDGAVIAQTASLSYTNNNLTAGTTYNYTVQAVDVAGNTSVNSSSKSVTTAATPDTIAPSNPSNVAASASSSSQVNLTWNASTDTGGSGLSGYNVYRSGSSSPLNSAPVTTTSYGDGTVTASTSYTYQIEAVDGVGNKSAKISSNNVTTPPAPTPPHNSQYISFLSPTAGETVSGRVDIQISASPPTPGENISMVELIVDGQVVNTNSSNKTTPYKMTWDARNISNGSHTLQARVTDRAGVSAITTITVMVNN